MKEEISLDIAMSKEEMAKIKELLTSSPGLRHYAFQLKKGEYLDLVEYKDYEKLEEENKSLQSQLKAKEELIKEAREETKQWIGYYKMKAKERYDKNTSVFVNSTCKKGYVLDVASKLAIIDLILSKGENK